MKFAFGMVLRQSQNRAAAPDFDIVGVTPETQNAKRPLDASVKIQAYHAPAVTVANPP
jgi:hypothetical protein